jgi:acetyl-CoA carboxylase biotin carboxylase subunit
MFDKVLVASRGESAVRIVQACRELGIKTVAIHSRVDAGSRAVQLADESVYVGPAQPDWNFHYYRPALITAARLTGAKAIHPGCGALAQDATFADICLDHRIDCIGPGPGVLACLADKVRVKRQVSAAGLPIVPGEAVHSWKEADHLARQLGYPVILKPVAGWKGRGLAVVWRPADLEQAFEAAQRGAQRFFKDRRLYVERFIERARPIEVQVLCDPHGRAVHVGERACAVQRQGRTLLAEAPARWLTAAQRHRLCDLALRAALALGYTGVATVEFLVDPEGQVYFLEVNSRLPVGGSVTDLVSGVDVLREQIRLAAAGQLRFTQDEVRFHGHALASHIHAADADNDWAPEAGVIRAFIPPGGPGTRVDTHVYSGWALPAFYEPLLLRLAVWAEDRPGAIDRMRRALGELTIEGVKTDSEFHQEALTNLAGLAA